MNSLFNTVKNNILTYTIIIITSIVLTGCHSISREETQSSKKLWSEHQQQLQQLNSFRVNGSIAYFNDSSRNFGRFSINQTSANNYALRLSTPIGGTIFSLKASDNYVEFIDNKGKRHTDTNVERLVYNLTGLNIPLNSLHSWLKGLSNNPDTDKIDQMGRLAKTELVQNNNKWLLNTSNYMTRKFNNNNIDLPGKIEITNKNERVRLTISNWAVVN